MKHWRETVDKYVAEGRTVSGAGGPNDPSGHAVTAGGDPTVLQQLLAELTKIRQALENLVEEAKKQG